MLQRLGNRYDESQKAWGAASAGIQAARCGRARSSSRGWPAPPAAT